MTTARAVIAAAYVLTNAGIRGATITLCLQDFARMLLELHRAPPSGPPDEGITVAVFPWPPPPLSHFSSPATPDDPQVISVYVSNKARGGFEVDGVLVRCEP